MRADARVCQPQSSRCVSSRWVYPWSVINSVLKMSVYPHLVMARSRAFARRRGHPIMCGTPWDGHTPASLGFAMTRRESTEVSKNCNKVQSSKLMVGKRSCNLVRANFQRTNHHGPRPSPESFRAFFRLTDKQPFTPCQLWSIEPRPVLNKRVDLLRRSRPIRTYWRVPVPVIVLRFGSWWIGTGRWWPPRLTGCSGRVRKPMM